MPEGPRPAAAALGLLALAALLALLLSLGLPAAGRGAPPSDSNLSVARLAAWAVPAAAEGVPRTIICTSKSTQGRGRLPLSWEFLNPEFRILHFNDSAVADLVRRHRPALYRHFPRLRPVQRADVFRYLALYLYGGVYTDMDVHCKIPIPQWPAEFGFVPSSAARLRFIVGLEFEQPPADDPALPFQLVQWTFASAAGNPVLEWVLRECESRLESSNRAAKDTDVIKQTGPVAWTAAWLKALTIFGEPPGHRVNTTVYPRVLKPLDALRHRGQVVSLRVKGETWLGLLLPYRAFGFHPAHAGSASTRLRNHLVEHDFRGSWRS
eukprot:EG_transcript_15642